MLKFQKINDMSVVSEYIAGRILNELAKGGKVLWLVAGGSAMDVAVKAAQGLAAVDNLDNLMVTLTDERFGAVGHADSNWRQLENKGFSLPGAQLWPVLHGKDMAGTAREYADFLNEAIDTCSYSMALAGMGPDGHIFGIKPGSPSVLSEEEVAGYDWDDFKRLTPTVKLLKKLDEVVVYAVGKEKYAQLDMLEGEVPALEQPAQQLKVLKNVTVFNDYKGERL